MQATASSAMTSPHSSHNMPNTRSVSPAGIRSNQPLPAPMPNRPPEAAADMVPGLLITGAGGRLPSVAPRGEAAQNIGLELYDDPRAKGRAAADEGQSCGVPRSGDRQ